MDKPRLQHKNPLTVHQYMQSLLIVVKHTNITFVFIYQLSTLRSINRSIYRSMSTAKKIPFNHEQAVSDLVAYLIIDKQQRSKCSQYQPGNKANNHYLGKLAASATTEINTINVVLPIALYNELERRNIHRFRFHRIELPGEWSARCA